MRKLTEEFTTIKSLATSSATYWLIFLINLTLALKHFIMVNIWATSKNPKINLNMFKSTKVTTIKMAIFVMLTSFRFLECTEPLGTLFDNECFCAKRLLWLCFSLLSPIHMRILSTIRKIQGAKPVVVSGCIIR